MLTDAGKMGSSLRCVALAPRMRLSDPPAQGSDLIKDRDDFQCRLPVCESWPLGIAVGDQLLWEFSEILSCHLATQRF